MGNRIAGGHGAAFITIIIWGTTFISTKVLLQTLAPVEILFVRFLIGYLALWCVCPRRLSVKDRRKECYFAAAGLCGVTLYYLLENIALTYTLASNVGVIISAAPFFTVIFSCLFLHGKRPGKRFYLGLLMALLGILLISSGSGEVFRLNPLGDLLAAAAAVVWAAYSTITKKISEFGCNTIHTTRRTFFYGLIFMIPAIMMMDFQVEISDFTDLKNILNLLFLGFGASAFCFVTWNFAVKILGSVRTSVYIYMVPVITAAASWFFLHEKLNGMMLLGILLTLAGLALSQNWKPDYPDKCAG